MTLGDGGQFRWSEVPDLAAKPGEVLIDVVAAGVNRADVLQRRGHYAHPPGASNVLGLECAGTIAALGDGVTGWQPGERVCALLSGGGYAEQAVVPCTQLLRVPAHLDLRAAAALPEAAATVWSNLIMDAHLRAGQLLLIHGGASGIGTHAIQVAVQRGATVAVTAGSDYKLKQCAELGAHILINYRETDFVAALHDNGYAGADIILDNMGAAYLPGNIDALALDGQLIVLGLQGGATATINLAALLAKRGVIRSSSLRARPATGRASKAAIINELSERLWPLIADGTIVPVIHAELPITGADEAHKLLDDPHTVGKVVLSVR